MPTAVPAAAERAGERRSKPYKQSNPLQYVDAVVDTAGGAQNTYGTHYIFGLLKQTIVGGDPPELDVQPDLSLQLYAQPLISAGRSTIPELAGRAARFTRYGSIYRPRSVVDSTIR